MNQSWIRVTQLAVIPICLACAPTPKPPNVARTVPPSAREAIEEQGSMCPIQVTVVLRSRNEVASTLEPIRKLALARVAELLSAFALDSEDLGDTATVCVFDSDQVRVGVAVSLPKRRVVLSQDATPESDSEWKLELLPDRLLMYQRETSQEQRDTLARLEIPPPSPGRIGLVRVNRRALMHALESHSDSDGPLHGLRSNVIARLPMLRVQSRQMKAIRRRLSEVQHATVALDCDSSELTMSLELVPLPNTPLAEFAAANARRDGALLSQAAGRANVAVFSNVDVAPLHLGRVDGDLMLMPWSMREQQLIEHTTSELSDNRTTLELVTIAQANQQATARLMISAPRPAELMQDTMRLQQLVWQRRFAMRLERARNAGRQSPAIVPDLHQHVPLGLLTKSAAESSVFDDSGQSHEAAYSGDLMIRSDPARATWQFAVTPHAGPPVTARGFAVDSNLVVDANAPLGELQSDASGQAPIAKDALDLARGPWFGAYVLLNRETQALSNLLPASPVFSSLAMDSVVSELAFGLLEAATSLGAEAGELNDIGRLSAVAWSSPTSIEIQARFRSEILPVLIQLVAAGLWENSNEEQR